jgi:hypothetical protein
MGIEPTISLRDREECYPNTSRLVEVFVSEPHNSWYGHNAIDLIQFSTINSLDSGVLGMALNTTIPVGHTTHAA